MAVFLEAYGFSIFGQIAFQRGLVCFIFAGLIPLAPGLWQARPTRDDIELLPGKATQAGAAIAMVEDIADPGRRACVAARRARKGLR